MNNLLLGGGSAANCKVNPSQRGVSGRLGLKRRKALWPLSYNGKQVRLSTQLFTRSKKGIYNTSETPIKCPRESKNRGNIWRNAWECIAIQSSKKKFYRHIWTLRPIAYQSTKTYCLAMSCSQRFGDSVVETLESCRSNGLVWFRLVDQIIWFGGSQMVSRWKVLVKR